MNLIRRAFRVLWKSPGFALTVVLTLALGIGATTAMFSIIDAVLLRRLPFKDPDRLVRVWKRDGNSGDFDISAPDVVDWRERAGCFKGVTATQEQRLALQSGVEAKPLYGRKVLTNFFDVIAAKPLLGRGFHSVETTAANEVVLSEKTWRGLFAAPRNSEVSLNGSAFVFAIVLATLMGLLSGLLPARILSKRIVDDLHNALRQKAGTGDRAKSLLQKALVLAQVICSVVLLSCTGLLFHSFLVLRNADTGIARPEKTLTARLDISPTTYPSDEDFVSFTRRLEQNLEQQPGVGAAGLINHTPLGHITNQVTAVPSSMGAVPQDQRKLAEYRVVAGDYFSAAGIPLIAGRLLDDRDGQDGEIRIVVNRSFTNQFWKDPQEAIGQKVLILYGSATIVGVTGDIRQVNLETRPTPEIDFSFPTALQYARSVNIQLAGQMIDPTVTIMLRGQASLRGEDLVAAVRSAVRTTDARLPVTEIKTVENLMDDNVSYRKFVVGLFAGLAILALLLATLGLYGVISFLVTHRMREIGVRIALGAQRCHILGLVTGSGMRLVFLGLLLGIGCVLCLSRLVNGFLYGITAADPITILGTAALVSAVALLAHLNPLRRAMKIDPIVALREE